jgi:beta-hydroxylase
MVAAGVPPVKLALMAKIIVLALVLLFFGCGLYMHLRGKVRHKVVAIV